MTMMMRMIMIVIVIKIMIIMMFIMLMMMMMMMMIDVDVYWTPHSLASSLRKAALAVACPLALREVGCFLSILRSVFGSCNR